MNPVPRPLPYEVYSGLNETRRKTETMSLREADRLYRRLVAEGENAEVWIGELRLRHGGCRRFTSMGGSYQEET